MVMPEYHQNGRLRLQSNGTTNLHLDGISLHKYTRRKPDNWGRKIFHLQWCTHVVKRNHKTDCIPPLIVMKGRRRLPYDDKPVSSNEARTDKTHTGYRMDGCSHSSIAILDTTLLSHFHWRSGLDWHLWVSVAVCKHGHPSWHMLRWIRLSRSLFFSLSFEVQKTFFL